MFAACVLGVSEATARRISLLVPKTRPVFRKRCRSSKRRSNDRKTVIDSNGLAWEGLRNARTRQEASRSTSTWHSPSR